MHKSFKVLAKPYIVWLFLLAVIPMFFMLILSFVNSEGISFDFASFTFEHVGMLFDRGVVVAFLNSVFYALLTTVLSFLLGYLVAYTIFKSKFKNKFLILTVFILPMWSNLLLRTEALGNLMSQNNLITSILSQVFNTQVTMPSIKGTGFAVVLGLVLTYLPFMILPIYTALEKIDYALEEAALDLGLTETQKFFKVILPLSAKGIATGSILVFLPAMSGFAIPEVLGLGNVLMIGNVIEQSFRYMNYNLGSILAIVILFFIMGAILIVSKVDKEGETLL